MPTLNELTKKPLERAEVISQSILSIDAKIEASATLPLGSVVVSIDDGATFKLCDSLPSTPYRLGILGDYAKDGEVANVVLIGVVKRVGEVANEIRTALFKANIIIKE